MDDYDSEEEEEQDFGEDELLEIEEAFTIHMVEKEIDEDIPGPRGLLPTQNLPYAMKEVGVDPTEAEVFEMLDEVDPNKTGFIDYKTFIELLRKNIKTLNEEQLKIVFSVFDRDGLGHIGTKEITYVTRNLGERYTTEEIEDMLKEVDADGDGKINYEDFVYFMTKR